MNNYILTMLILNALISIWNIAQNKALRGRVYRYMDWIDNFNDKEKRIEIAGYANKK